METLNKYDRVLWRHKWGMAEQRSATVTAIEVQDPPGSKVGFEVESIPWTHVKGRDVIVTLDNGSWAWANQIKPLIRD